MKNKQRDYRFPQNSYAYLREVRVSPRIEAGCRVFILEIRDNSDMPVYLVRTDYGHPYCLETWVWEYQLCTLEEWTRAALVN